MWQKTAGVVSFGRASKTQSTFKRQYLGREYLNVRIDVGRESYTEYGINGFTGLVIRLLFVGRKARYRDKRENFVLLWVGVVKEKRY